jgi:hypothetical protein
VFEPGYPTSDERLINLRPVTRREAYAADITYGTNNEFGFDYLRDNMVMELDQRVQRERYFAIVDEVDNILIDEARTPLIISGQARSRRTCTSRSPASCRAEGAPRGRRGGRRLLHRPQGPASRRPRRASTRSSGSWASRTCTTPTRAWPATSSRRSGPRPLQARPRLHRQGRRDRHRRRVHRAARCPAGAGREGLHQAIEAKEGLRVQRES